MSKFEILKPVGQGKNCPKCGAAFECMGDDCQCHNYQIINKNIHYIRQTWDNCLCPVCLKDFAENKVADGMLYSFLTYFNIQISQVNPWFLGMNLLTPGNIALTILAALLMYIQMTMMQWVQPKPAVPATLTGGQATPDMA